MTQDTNTNSFPWFPKQKRYAVIYATKQHPWPTIWHETMDDAHAEKCAMTLSTVPNVLGTYVYDRQERKQTTRCNDVLTWTPAGQDELERMTR